MKRAAAMVLACLVSSGALAEERAPDTASEDPTRPHGILSHGDSASFMEDFFGPQVQRAPPETQETARDKRDPGIRWTAPATGR